MDRLISLQAAIDAIEAEKQKRGDYLTSSYVGFEVSENVIKALPSAQPEPQWIPCSEPPTEHGFHHEILLYGKDENYAVGWYDEDYFTWDDRFDMDTPVAWCKLPKPWRGEEHGKTD